MPLRLPDRRCCSWPAGYRTAVSTAGLRWATTDTPDRHRTPAAVGPRRNPGCVWTRLPNCYWTTKTLSSPASSGRAPLCKSNGALLSLPLSPPALSASSTSECGSKPALSANPARASVSCRRTWRLRLLPRPAKERPALARPRQLSFWLDRQGRGSAFRESAVGPARSCRKLYRPALFAFLLTLHDALRVLNNLLQQWNHAEVAR